MTKPYLFQAVWEMLGHTQRIWSALEMLDMAGIAANEVNGEDETVVSRLPSFECVPWAVWWSQSRYWFADWLWWWEEATAIALMIHQKTKSARKSSSLFMKKQRPWWTLRRSSPGRRLELCRFWVSSLVVCWKNPADSHRPQPPATHTDI